MIPSVKGANSLSHVISGLRSQTDRGFALVIVDDGLPEPLSPTSYVLDDFAEEITIARHVRNYGGAAALNTGCLLAETKKILMLDDDMVLPSTAIAEFKNLLALGDDVCAVGFRGTFEPGENGNLPRAALEDDWRCDVTADSSFMNMAIGRSGDTSRRHFRLLDETSDFRAFGSGRVIGYWDLPVMVGGHTVAVDRHLYLQAGGTPEWCVGWGMRDTALGAALIASGAYIIPQTRAVAAQVAHPPLAGTRQAQLNESRANLARYRRWLTHPAPDPISKRRFAKSDNGPNVEVEPPALV